MNRTHSTYLVAVASFVMASCQGAGDDAAGSAAARPDAPQAAEGAPTLHELKNAAYSGFEDLGSVTLIDGVWEGEPYAEDSALRPEVVLLRDFRITGDVDGDGTDEAVVLLNVSLGGTGQFLHLAVVDRNEGRVENVAAEMVGDRVQVRGVRIEDGWILMDVVQAGSGDAACCPGEVTTLGWELLPEGRLSPLDVSGEPGRLSLETIGGTEWVLREWSWGEPALAEPEVTLRYEDGRLVGRSGCNNYFTTPEEGEMPGDVSVGPIGSTRMACPEPAMAVESRFLEQLGAVNGFGFMVTQLALSYEKDGASGVMLFDAR